MTYTSIDILQVDDILKQNQAYQTFDVLIDDPTLTNTSPCDSFN